MRVAVYVYLFLSFGTISSGEFPALKPSPTLNPLPLDVLAFGAHSENFRERIIGTEYDIWSEEKLMRWASAQGLRVSADHNSGGIAWHRVAVITSPGIKFYLQRPVTEKGSEFANGWRLYLDFAKIESRSPRGGYHNILETEVFIDGIKYASVMQGAKIDSTASPLEIEIPHIRDSEGKIEVELRLANHPRNFLFLYDAHLGRSAQ